MIENIKPVKAGISGCGGITPHVLRGLEGIQDVEITAVQDIDPKAAERVASDFNIPAHFSDLSDLLSTDVEFVILNTPNDIHKSQALEVFKAGKHCMVQKPLARNAQEGEIMVKAANDAGLLLGVVMLERSDPVYRQIRAMIEADCFGQITVLRAALAHTNHIYYQSQGESWRNDPSKIGGGSFLQLAVHQLDLAQFLLNQNVSIVHAVSTSMIQPEKFPEDETTAAVVKFESGTVGQFISSFSASVDSIELFGTGGKIKRDERNITWVVKEHFAGEVWDSGRPGESHEILMPEIAPIVGHLTSQYEPHRLFAHAIRGDGEVETPGEMGLQILRVVEAVMKSATDHEATEVN